MNLLLYYPTRMHTRMQMGSKSVNHGSPIQQGTTVSALMIMMSTVPTEISSSQGKVEEVAVFGW